MADDDMADLALALLDGPFEEPLWQGFLDLFRARLGADYASLIFRAQAPLRPSLVHLYSGEPYSPLLERLYRESMHQSDPVDYHRLTADRVYRLGDFINGDDPAHEAFRQTLLTPGGVNDSRLLRVVEPSGVNIWLNASRKAGMFRAEDDRLMARLAPFLRASLRGFVALEQERFNAAVASEAIRRLSFGWLALDAKGIVLDGDAEGRRMLEQSGVFQRGAGGRLAARDGELDREIVAAIKAIAREPQSRPRALVLNRDPWLDMLLVPAHRRALPSATPPAVIAYVHGDGWSSADRCDQLAELFELLPSEARLALALSRGMTIAEAADDLGLTIETARSYSKKIYAKTGARGQPDLVRFIHRSVLTIA
ncbi:helix-turn-helix transcriptional regulator [Sphingomonas naphthae]|uniref:Helix-turn-helix transcriptional regulator n=1 Tax=Sphingomonas naphthae TaxID=1813468 RepID=A0ABY7TKB6_9SPHN|nr:helix-turn-helix transcriptional regulator [Sphingomonas naphthae]WCT73609.1 helix-turn-helix transcriptional regulator [Sphingomonas naphthae]